MALKHSRTKTSAGGGRDVGGDAPYLLLRGGRILARIAELPQSESPSLICGVLFALEPDAELRPWIQSRIDHDPGERVLLRDTTGAGRGPIALQRLSDKEASGVPRRRQLVIVDSRKRPVATDSIALRYEQIRPDTGPFAGFCRALGLNEAVWIVFAKQRASNEEEPDPVA